VEELDNDASVKEFIDKGANSVDDVTSDDEDEDPDDLPY
jgi:hypothetical protein